MTKAETPEQADEAPAKGGKKKVLVLGLVAVLVLAGGAWFFLFAGSSAEAEAPHEGVVAAVDSVSVNLAGGHYLKVGVALQFTEEAGEESHDPETSKVKDLIVAHFSQAPVNDVQLSREAMKAALEQKIIHAYEGLVMGIYYTEYVTQ